MHRPLLRVLGTERWTGSTIACITPRPAPGETNMAACGLDFGTSNTTLGIAAADGQPKLAPLEGSATTLPSAVFFDFDSAGMLVGKEAVDAYAGGADGRLMRA